MSLRRKAREHALQMLFQSELSGSEPARVEESFWKSARAEPKTRLFANHIFEGTLASRGEIDQLLEANAANWRLDRMAAIDRNILRMAVFELRSGETPPPAVIDEALELAKKFSGENSAAFVNGVLDAVRKSLAAGATG